MTVHDWREFHEKYPELTYCQEFDPRMLEGDGLKLEIMNNSGEVNEVLYDQIYAKEKLRHDFFNHLKNDEQFSTFMSILDAVVEEAYARTENS